MSVLMRNSWVRHLAVILVTVVSLGAMTFASTPAEARVFVGVGVPVPGWGYHAPAPYYPYAYYPAYWYYPGGVFLGGVFGPHHHPYYRHWR